MPAQPFPIHPYQGKRVGSRRAACSTKSCLLFESSFHQLFRLRSFPPPCKRLVG